MPPPPSPPPLVDESIVSKELSFGSLNERLFPSLVETRRRGADDGKCIHTYIHTYIHRQVIKLSIKRKETRRSSDSNVLSRIDTNDEG